MSQSDSKSLIFYVKIVSLFFKDKKILFWSLIGSFFYGKRDFVLLLVWFYVCWIDLMECLSLAIIKFNGIDVARGQR